jgi:RNA polymerase sigma factor (sigma-70 family)
LLSALLLKEQKMKYDYHFSNETISIDVPDSDYDVLIELDRVERNTNQKETRRHVSLEAYNVDDNLFPSASNVEASCIRDLENEALLSALEKLTPQQCELIWKVFFENRTMASLAREEGVGESTVRERLNRSYKKLKNLLK